MKKIILALTVGLFSMHATGATWKDTGSYLEISKIYPFDYGLIFYTSYKDTTVSSCDSGSRFMIHKNDENYNLKTSALMAAFMAKKKILFRYDADQTRACEARINRFLIQ